MPTESLRIKGQFFNLRTELILSPSKGYKSICKEVSRYRGESEPSESELNVHEILKLIDKKVAILELNFDMWSLFDTEEVISKVVNTSVLASRYANHDSMLASFRINPVIATTKTDQILSYEILDQYMQQTSIGSSLAQINGADFLVLTGEMVWSEWLNNNLVAYLLSKISPNDANWHLDRFGIWQYILEQPLTNRISRGINQQELAPNLFFHKTGKKEKTIKLLKNDQKRELIIDGKQRFYSDMAGNIFNNMLLPQYLVIGGEEANNNEPLTDSSLFIKSEISIKRENKAEIILPDKEVFVDEKEISFEQKQYKVVRLFDYAKKIKILVSHGQKVEKDEVIAQNLSISGKMLNEKFVSPINGYVDLSNQKDGIMLLWSKIDEKVKMNIQRIGKYMGGQDGKFLKLQGKIISIPVESVLGKPVAGFLVKNILPDFDGLPKILLLNYSELKLFQTEQLLDERVRGLIFDHLTFKQIDEILKNRYELFTLFTVCAVDCFTEESNPIFIKELNANIGQMAAIKDDSVQVIDNKIKQQRHGSENKLVKLISYNSNFRYYDETRKVSDDKVLLSNGKNIVEANICNLLYVKDEPSR